ncbi:MAG: exodeoxyribonuclease VII small subunit [Bacteroidota bacterium]
MSKSTPTEFSLEAKLREVRLLLDKMQRGDQNFDENMRLFQQGTQTIQACRDYLDQAELSIRELIATDDGPQEVEFD